MEDSKVDMRTYNLMSSKPAWAAQQDLVFQKKLKYALQQLLYESCNVFWQNNTEFFPNELVCVVS